MKIILRLYIFVAILVTSACKKCDVNALIGKYARTNTDNYGYLQIDSSGNHWVSGTYINTDTVYIRDISGDEEAINVTHSPSTYESFFVYSKKCSTFKICCFVGEDYGGSPTYDTIWFDRNGSHAFNMHYATLSHFSSSDVIATGHRIR